MAIPKNRNNIYQIHGLQVWEDWPCQIIQSLWASLIVCIPDCSWWLLNGAPGNSSDSVHFSGITLRGLWLMGISKIIKAIYDNSTANMGFPGGSSGKEPTCPSRRHKRCEFNPWVRKIPWKRAWQLTSVFLPGELYGQRTLAATVHRVTKSHKWLSLKQLSMHSQYNTQWWKAESLSAKIWNKSRMPHLQHISSI